MRVPPQVSDRIKEAPAQALRAVFAGIGQLLLITDKLRSKISAQVPQARAPRAAQTRPKPAPPTAPARATISAVPPAPVPPAAPVPVAAPVPPAVPVPVAAPVSPAVPVRQADGVSGARDLDKTGNVRLLTSEEAAARGTAPAVDAMMPVGEDAAVTEETRATAPVTEPEPDVPLPNYDQLPVASLRARLRNLDAAQVKQLAEYERAHAARADVIAMFERRMAKLEAGG
jgi:hypothetical protein